MSRWHERSWPFIGTYLKAAVWADQADAAEALLEQGRRRLQTIAFALSDYEDLSDVGELNRHRSRAIHRCSSDFLELLTTALRLQQETGGQYTPLIGALSHLWRRCRREGVEPSLEELAAAQRACCASSVRYDNEVIRLIGSSALDFGGIGKGFLAERGVEFFTGCGITYARVDCGGDLAFGGTTEWEVLVEDPAGGPPLGALLLRGDLQPRIGVATSGSYRSCWEYRGRVVHHIFDPLTGQSPNYIVQATVIHPSAAVADALSTALFGMEPAAALKFVEAYAGAAALIVLGDSTAVSTPGLTFHSGRSLPEHGVT